MLAIIRRLLQTYQAPLNALQTEVDKAEEALFLRNGGPLSLEHLYYQKARVRVLKKLLQLNQNVLADLQLHPEEASALQDARDRALALLVICEELLDDQNSLMNTYFSLSASRTNEAMKLLTIFSAFFLPLTFIARIYGMNFDIMPELRWPWGYYFALGLMLLVAGVVYVWFKRKKICKGFKDFWIPKSILTFQFFVVFYKKYLYHSPAKEFLCVCDALWGGNCSRIIHFVSPAD